MNDSLILVLTAPGDEKIPFLTELRDAATIVVGDSVSEFTHAALDAEIILNWSGSLALLRDVFLMSRRAMDPLPVCRIGTGAFPRTDQERGHSHQRQWCLQPISRGVCLSASNKTALWSPTLTRSVYARTWRFPDARCTLA